jgi:uncharacterized protein YceK
MDRRAIPAALLLPLLVVAVAVWSSACGTIANFTGGAPIIGIPPDPPPPPIAFGGVWWDIEQAIESDAPMDQKALIFPLWLVDLGLSATLDTATLPIVFWLGAKRAWLRATGDPATQPPAEPPGWSRKSTGWYPDQAALTPTFTPTPAEQLLIPQPPPKDPD